MGGKRGRSGPPNNLNAAKHGLTAWLKRRALPAHKRHVGILVDTYRQGLLSCKGGEEAVTEVESALVQNAATAYGAILLVMEEAKARGMVRVVDGSWDLSPGFSRLVGFLGAERQALLAIGVSRRPREIEAPSLDQIKAKYDTPRKAKSEASR